VNRYRIATSAELDQGARDEVFDVEADAFQISARGGVRVVRYTEPEGGLLARMAAAIRPPTENVAWVPHDCLMSCRLLTDDETPARRLPPADPSHWAQRPEDDPALSAAAGQALRREARIQ
jgi:hypothetical protein